MNLAKIVLIGILGIASCYKDRNIVQITDQGANIRYGFVDCDSDNNGPEVILVGSEDRFHGIGHHWNYAFVKPGYENCVFSNVSRTRGWDPYFEIGTADTFSGIRTLYNTVVDIIENKKRITKQP